MREIEPKVDEPYDKATISELADAPVDVLHGVSSDAAQALIDAFGIHSIRDMGTNKFFLWAQAIVTLAEGSSPRSADLPELALVYVSSDEAAGHRLTNALRLWLHEWGLEIEESDPAEIGSWLQRFSLQTRSMLGSKSASETLREMAEAARSYLAEEQHAKVDQMRSESFKNVMDALKDEDESIVMLGEMIIVKAGGKVRARPITAVLARQIQENPRLQTSPESVMQLLWPGMKSERLSDASDGSSAAISKTSE